MTRKNNLRKQKWTRAKHTSSNGSSSVPDLAGALLLVQLTPAAIVQAGQAGRLPQKAGLKK